MPEKSHNQPDSIEQTTEREVPPPPPTSFPWSMLCLAIFFDILGVIPIINFFTEILAGLIFGMWQKNYVPKVDPILTFFVAKIIDVASFGFLPSNIGVVIYSYIKKKAANKIYNALKTPTGMALANKMLKS